MFSTKEKLLQKTGEDGIGRFDFLRMLVKEFKETKSREAKKQVLANLSNFAYDPINYEYIRRLQIIDLFLEQTAESDDALTEFALAGICNLSLDPKNKQYILRRNGIKIVSDFLSREKEEIILNTITILMNLDSPEFKDQLTSDEIIHRMLELQESDNIRIKNLATIFLEDFYKGTESGKTDKLT